MLSDHPGFNSNLTIGSLTVSFQHQLQSSELCESESLQQINQPTNANLEETKQFLANKIADELIEQKNIQSEFNKNQIVLNNNNLNGLIENADESAHKFIHYQFNDTVACEFCNKKVSFFIIFIDV